MPEHSTHNLLLSENFPPHVGGSARWFWELYRRLPVAEQIIAAGAHPEASSWDNAQSLRIERLPLHMDHWGLSNLGALRSYYTAWSRLRAIVAACKQRGGAAPVIHAGRCLPEGWLAWLLARTHGIRYLVYVHGEDVNAAATSREYRWMVQRVLRRAEVVIANSRNTAELLQHDWQLPADQTSVLYPGVDTERFRPAPRDPELRRRWGWDDRRVVLTVGRLQRRKGQDHLITALAQVRRRIPDVLYAICGAGEELEKLKQLARQHGVEQHVQFLGEVDDQRLLQSYQQCDLFALPNRTLGHDFEGFGMVLIEAQACGKPVLAGDSGGTRETLSPDITGWLVDCQQIDVLATRLTQILEQPERLASMGQAARRWVESRFDWEPLSRQAADLFREVATGVMRPHAARRQAYPAPLAPSTADTA